MKTYASSKVAETRPTAVPPVPLVPPTPTLEVLDVLRFFVVSLIEIRGVWVNETRKKKQLES